MTAPQRNHPGRRDPLPDPPSDPLSDPLSGPLPDPLSKVFAALADPTRRDIVARLATADATVTELAVPYRISVQAISKHLMVLEQAGLVTKSRQAQRRPVHLEAEVFDLMTAWIERYRRQAEQRYRRLDGVLAELAGESSDVPPADTDRDVVATSRPEGARP